MYNNLSDLEINKRVAHALGYTVQGRGWISCGDGIYDYIAESADPDSYRSVLPNYCNNWAEAGPIIEENGICLEKETSDTDIGELYETGGWRAVHAIYRDYFRDSNPLRAAMIVFLMTEELK